MLYLPFLVEIAFLLPRVSHILKVVWEMDLPPPAASDEKSSLYELPPGADRVLPI